MHPLLRRRAAVTPTMIVMGVDGICRTVATGDALPPPPPTGSAENTTGVVIALAVLALSIVGLRAANRDAAHWGGAGKMGG